MSTPQGLLPEPYVCIRHRVAFAETDAMGVVHHANYLLYLERARIAWLDEYDQPYREYMAQDRHLPIIGVTLRYLRSARFDDRLAICCWLAWLRGASLGMAYEIHRGAEPLVAGSTEHAVVDGEGHPRRLSPLRRAALGARVAAPRRTAGC